jgi:hypothetical protein
LREPVTEGKVDVFEAWFGDFLGDSLVETPEFLAAARRIMDEEERGLLVDYLARNRRAGELLPAARGARQLRWALQGGLWQNELDRLLMVSEGKAKPPNREERQRQNFIGGEAAGTIRPGPWRSRVGKPNFGMLLTRYYWPAHTNILSHRSKKEQVPLRDVVERQGL